MINQKILKGLLKDIAINPIIIVENVTDSTNLYAKRLISDGLSTNALVIAEIQESGKGRFNREWYSPPGGLYMTLVLCSDNSEISFPLYGLALASAAANVIGGISGLSVAIKWPNDLLVGEKKLGGILSELVSGPDKASRILLGIGINVNNEVAFFPNDIKEASTSIISETGKQYAIEIIASRIVTHLSRSLLGVSTSSHILKEYKDMCNTVGRRVNVTMADESFQGTAVGIDGDGALIVKDQYNNVRLVNAGEITHLRSA